MLFTGVQGQIRSSEDHVERGLRRKDIGHWLRKDWEQPKATCSWLPSTESGRGLRLHRSMQVGVGQKRVGSIIVRFPLVDDYLQNEEENREKGGGRKRGAKFMGLYSKKFRNNIKETQPFNVPSSETRKSKTDQRGTIEGDKISLVLLKEGGRRRQERQLKNALKMPSRGIR